MESQPFPSKCTDVFSCDKEWISKALNLKVKTIEFKPMVPGNTGPTLTRVFLQLEDGSSLNVIAKYCSAADMKSIPWLERSLQSLTDFSVELLCQKEVHFYEQLQPLLTQHANFLSTPPCHYIAFDKDNQPNIFAKLLDIRSGMKMLLLMADLSGLHTEPLGSFMTTRETASSALRVLARFHAPQFHHAHPEMVTFPISESARHVLRLPEKFRSPTNFDNVVFPRGQLFRVSAQLLFSEKNLMNIPNVWASHALFGHIFQDDEVLMVLELLSKNVLTLVEIMSRTNTYLFQHLTLLHGDCHMNNIFFPCSKEDFELGKFDTMYLIDWQMFGIGCPSFELVYFLSVNVKFDRENYLGLRDEYFEELSKNLTELQRGSYTKEIFELECDILACHSIVGLLAAFVVTDQNAMADMMATKEDVAKSLSYLLGNVFRIVAFILPELLEKKEFLKLRLSLM